MKIQPDNQDQKQQTFQGKPDPPQSLCSITGGSPTHTDAEDSPWTDRLSLLSISTRFHLVISIKSVIFHTQFNSN